MWILLKRVLRRKIQSTIDEGRLIPPTMQIDQNHFPMHTHVLELKNPKVLIRPSQAESTKGKMWSLEKKDLGERCCRARLLELQRRHQHSGGNAKKRRLEAIWSVRPVRRAVWPVPRAVWPVPRPVWPVLPVILEIPPRPNLKQGRASKSSWQNMRRRELSTSRRNGQMKPEVPN